MGHDLHEIEHQSEKLKISEGWSSVSDSQKLSGTAVIDGRNFRRPDKAGQSITSRGPKVQQFTQVKMNPNQVQEFNDF